MLDYEILSKKPTIKMIKNGEVVECKDLSAKIYNGFSFSGGGQYILVNKEYVARPDLISLAIYGNDHYADIICKINEISNPFELNENMLLYLPDIDNITKMCSGAKNEDDVLDEFKSLKKYKELHASKSNFKLSDSYNKYIEEESINKKKKNLQKYKNERRSPGEQTVSDTNYVIDKTLGVVIY